LEAIRYWFNNAKDIPAFANITTKMKELPPLEQNSVLEELKFDSLEKFDF
jgi:hypothetical protein